MQVVGSSRKHSPKANSSSFDLQRQPITRELLVGLRNRGLRNRVWFRALDRIERGLVDLTIRWVDRVKSGKMTTTLLRILKKLSTAMETGMARVLIRGGRLAEKASALAVSWGNEAAFAWRFDQAYREALGLGLLS